MILGNIFEHYDVALYSLLSPFFAPIFFPTNHPVTALILTYAIIPLGMLARPIGSLLFGYIGDQYGRVSALYWSLMGLAVSTAAIGFTPTYEQAGFFAPLLLLFGRILQNFFAAGEVSGGAIYLLEANEKPQRDDLLSALFSASTVLGILLASFAVSLLSYFHAVESSWRYLYFAGSVTALLGTLMRRLACSDNEPLVPEKAFSIREYINGFFENSHLLFPLIVASGFSYACYSVAFTLMNGFIPLISDLDVSDVMAMNTGLLFLDLLLLPVFGFLAMRFSRKTIMGAAAGGSVLLGLPIFMLLQSSYYVYILFARLILIFIGVSFSATLYSWAQEMVPKSYRYSLISFSYSIGTQLLGGPTAAISIWLYKETGMVSSASWYWMALGALTCYLLFAKQSHTFKETQSVN
jgi:MFS family permease